MQKRIMLKDYLPDATAEKVTTTHTHTHTILKYPTFESRKFVAIAVVAAVAAAFEFCFANGI